MKPLMMLIILLVATTVHGAEVDLMWEPSPTESVTGYVLYYGQDSANLEYAYDVGNQLTATVDGLGVGTWYFGVTAYNDVEESELSNIVNMTEDGFVPPNNIHVPVIRPATVNITIEVQ